MVQARTTDRVADQAEAGCSLTCECWDCRSWRRHLLKLSAALLLACALGGEVGWQRGWWRGDAAAPAAEVEPASAPAAMSDLF
jgi:hypothetical protein